LENALSKFFVIILNIFLELLFSLSLALYFTITTLFEFIITTKYRIIKVQILHFNGFQYWASEKLTMHKSDSGTKRKEGNEQNFVAGRAKSFRRV
jgi:hypothetical protein